METPQTWGWFHLLWIFASIIAIILLCIKDEKCKHDNLHRECLLKWILSVYGFTALILEITKQIIWSFNYDTATGIVTWDYQWYAAPFQLCTTPIFVSIIAIFLKPGKMRKALFSYISYVTILGSVITMFIPKSCFTDYIEVNVHTMWLHCGSFVLSMYLLICGFVEDEKKNLQSAVLIFAVAATIANVLNIVIYKSGILGGETFNMFYISPYFVSGLPVFDKIWQSVPYPIFLLIYVFVIVCGAVVVFVIHKYVKLFFEKRSMRRLRK